MAIDEEYLDDLLQSITENEEEPRTMDDAMREMASSSEEEKEDWEDTSNDFWEDIPEDLLTQAGDPEYENTVALDNFIEESLPEAEDVSDKDVDLEEMELLKEITAAGLSYEEASSDLSSDDDGLDIAGMMDGLGIGDEDLEEIQGLINKTDESAAVDKDILALLESIEKNEESDEAEDPFKLFEDENTKVVQEAKTVEEPVPKEKKTKKKKNRKEKPNKAEKSEKKFGIMGKKKRKALEENSSEEEAMPIEDEEIALSEEEVELEEREPGIESFEETEELEGEKGEKATDGKKEKKPGFFARLIAAIAQDDEEFDSASEENKKLLKEIGEEEQKGKKGKKKKGKGGADAGAKASKKADKKQKKPKKEKAPKKPKEKKVKETTGEKPSKPIGKRTLFVAIALGGTLLASIMLLSVFLPEYADKQAAKRAFYSGDYETVYTLLYDKKLSADDALLYNKAKTICTIERKLKSYENNLTLGRELEAVDALLNGVDCYQSMTEADEYGVRREVDALYQQICSILENDYGITSQEALEMTGYDSGSYTRKLHTVVYGTDFGNPGAEAEPEVTGTAQPSQDILPDDNLPEDILPEEEEIMGN